MRVKLTKKMLCAVLSLLMVITSLPMVAFAGEEEDTAASNLYTAIESYKIKMNGTIYENMPAAYDAYCEARKLYDKYMYTKAKFDSTITASNLNDAASKLTKATDAMTEWVPGSNITEVQPAQEERGLTITQESYYNNILYTESLSNSSIGQATVGGADVNIYHGNAVVYYNGEDDTAVVPVGVSTKTNNLYSAYPNQGDGQRRDSNDIALGYLKGKSDVPDTILGNDNFWIGTWAGSADFVWSFEQFRDYPENRRYASADYSTGVKILADPNRYQHGEGSNLFLFNGMKVKALTKDQYSKTITPTWYIVAGDTSTEGYITNDTAKIYVVNYNALTQAIERNSQKISLNITNAYAAGGLKNVITAFDNAIKINISNSDTYNYASDMETAVKNAAQKIQETVEALDSAESKADPSEYQALRDAIDSQRARYEENIGDDFAEMKNLYTNAEQFISNYDAALEAMNTAVTSEQAYSDAEETLKSVASVAETLNTFLLEGEKPRVDTVALENTIDNAQYIIDNSTFFDKTAADESQVQKIKDAIKTAKVNIWGAEENYPLDRFEPEDIDDNFIRVLTEVSNIRATIAGFKINDKAKVSYVTDKNGETQSLDDVRTTAKDIIDNHSADYANSATLQATYDYTSEYLADSAKITLSETATTRQNYVRDFVNSYKDLVVTLYDAINSLTPAFTASIANGTIIKGGTGADTSFDIPGERRNYKFENFIRATNQVIFRTTNEAFDVTLSKASIVVSTDVNSNDNERNIRNYIDALNFDADANTWGNNTEKNTSNNTFSFASSKTLSDANKNNHPGNLTATANDGAKYTVKNIYVTSTKAPRKGSDASGNDAGDIAFDSFLTNTAESVDGAGVNLFDGNTVMTADYVLSLPVASDENCTQKTYSLTKNLGAIIRFKNKSGITSAQGYGWNYTSYTQSTTVINIAPLLDKINEANELVSDPSKQYTSDSLNALLDALNTADDAFAYWGMEVGTSDDGKGNNKTTDTIMGVINSRFEKLDNAINNLKERADFTKQIDFNGSNYNYTEAKNLVFKILNGNISESDPNYETYYAQTFSKESLEKLVEYLTGQISSSEAQTANHDNWEGKDRFEYLNCNSDTDRYNVPASEQAKINWEIRQLLTAVSLHDDVRNPNGILEIVDRSTYSAAVSMAQNLNADAYDVDAVKKVVEENPLPNYSVSVNGNQIVCNTQEDVERVTGEITTAVTDAWYKYSVTVVDKDGNKYYLKNADGDLTEINGDAEKADFHYGDIVKVKSFDDGKAAFSTTVIAKGTGKQSDKRLITTATEYQFDVRGDTEVYVTSAESDEHVKITFIDSRDDRAIAFDYVPKDEAYKMTEALVPKFMYYTFKNFTVKDGENDGAGTTVEKDSSYTFKNDTEVVINYELSGTHESAGKYDVKVLGTDGNQISENSYDYNVRVRVTVDGAAAFVDADTYESDSPEVIAYGDSYAFYTCQSITLRAVDEAYLSQHNLSNNNYSVSVIKAPIVDGNSVQIVGTFASSDNAKPKQYGIVLDASGNMEGNLDLSMVKNSSKIYNFSCSKIIGENQFASSVTFGTAPEKFRYVAYAIYHFREDTTGMERDVIVYSPIKTYTKGV